MFTKILIPLDGSPLAERALAPAFALAREPNTEVLLFRVAYPEQIIVPEHGVTGARGVVWPDQAALHSRREADAYLAGLQSAYASPGQLVWAKVVLADSATPDVAAHIVETARAERTDLIVMSSHGRSGMERWVFGSVAERVLSAAPCPVLAVRGDRPIRHILVPLDGSALAETALEPALTAAARMHGTVTLLQVAPTVRSHINPQGGVTYHFFGPGVPGSIKLPLKVHAGQSLQDNLRDEALTYLARLRAQLGRYGVPIQTAAEVGPAAEGILGFVEQHGVDCIAMATHGHTGLRRWVYGSVTHKVMRRSRCALLVVRPA